MESRIHREVYVRFGREYGTVEIDDRLCLPHDLDVQVGKLKLAKANYLSEKYDLEDKIIQYYPKKLAMIREQIESYEKDLNVTNDVEEFSGMSLQGKSTHNRRERPVYGHRGGSRGRFYYRITTFEGRPWDARDPHKTTFMALSHAIRLSI